MSWRPSEAARRPPGTAPCTWWAASAARPTTPSWHGNDSWRFLTMAASVASPKAMLRRYYAVRRLADPECFLRAKRRYVAGRWRSPGDVIVRHARESRCPAARLTPAGRGPGVSRASPLGRCRPVSLESPARIAARDIERDIDDRPVRGDQTGARFPGGIERQVGLSDWLWSRRSRVRVPSLTQPWPTNCRRIRVDSTVYPGNDRLVGDSYDAPCRRASRSRRRAGSDARRLRRRKPCAVAPNRRQGLALPRTKRGRGAAGCPHAGRARRG
jgi:hypothetical protein